MKTVTPRKRRHSLIILIGLVIVGLGVGGWAFSRTKTSSTTETSTTARADKALLDSCTTDMATTFHIHSHLTVTISGQGETIAANTGISSDCMHSLHAHDATGIVHIESPVKKDFSLGDWFYIWGKTWTATDFNGQPLDASHQLKVFADGHEITTGPETILQDHVTYAVIYGNQGETLSSPAKYQFPANL